MSSVWRLSLFQSSIRGSTILVRDRTIFEDDSYTPKESLHMEIILLKTADENGDLGLNIDEFRSSFNRILGEENDKEMIDMFMKIDAGYDGVIDWVS